MPEDAASIADWFKTAGAAWGVRILGSIAIIVIGRWAGRALANLLQRGMTARKVDPIVTKFVTNIAGGVVLAIVIVGAIQNLGVPTASFVAVIGAAGLAVGLALQGSLSHFAAGIIMIVLRPFKVGDYIEGGGVGGTVDEITVFHTRLRTPDNRLIVVPNSKLNDEILTNFSAMDTRRLDLVFGVAYEDDMDKVRAIFQRIAAEDGRILKNPQPEFVVDELADSSVNFIFRVWVNTGDFWPVRFDTIERVKKAFDNEGVTIPFPQRNIHLASGDAARGEIAAA